jgi:peptide/nickel transport system ATP-binding protein
VPSANARGTRLAQIPGMTPSLINLAPGCRFRSRCPRADTECTSEPAISEPLARREVRCWRPHLEGAMP